MKKVAVTGGLACGKSTVCHYLKQLGASCVSADDIVHQLLTPETEVGKKVIAALGPDSVKEGKIDRALIARRVFSDPHKLHTIERILHPAVLKEIENEYERAKKLKTSHPFVAEIPLLFECAWESYFDVVIAVVASEDVCKKRAEKGSPALGRDFENRMQRQMPVKEKLKRSTYTIENNGSLNDLFCQVDAIYKFLVT